MKQTEIGLIPDDWEVKTLGDVAEIKTGPFGSALHASDYVLIGTPIITVEHIGTISIRKDIDIPMVNEIDRERLKAYSLITGDLIFSRVGAVDRNCVVSDKESGWLFSGRLLRVRLNKSVIPLYMSYHLSMKDSKDRILAVAVGLAMPSINTKILSGLKIVLPPLAEQQRIAKALSDVDALISTTEKLIQKKKNIKYGTMQNLLTGKKRLPGFAKSTNYKQSELGLIPEDWEVKTLDELCSLITKQTGFDYSATIKPSLVLEHQKDTLPFIQNKDFEEEKINFETDFYIPISIAKKFSKIYLNEDVLLISISGRIGNVAYFKHTQDAFIGGAVGIAHFYDKQNINYCMRYLLSPNGQMQIFANEKSGAQHNLTIADVRKLSIPMPKDQKELTAIANVLSCMDKEIETLNTKLEKYRNLKTAMMQQLLTGKIRL